MTIHERAHTYPDLHLALQRLELMLRRQVLRLRARHHLVEQEFRGTFISDAQIDALFEQNGYSAHDEPASIQSLTDQIALLTSTQRHAEDSGFAHLAGYFQLSEIESDILAIVLAPMLDSRFEIYYAYVQNDIARKAPTIDLALKLLFPEFNQRLWAQQFFRYDQPLLQHHLIDLVRPAGNPTIPWLSYALKIDPRIAAYLLRQDMLDQRLHPFTKLIQQPTSVSDLPFSSDLIDQLIRAVPQLADRGGIMCLQGVKGVGKQRVAAALAAQQGWRLISVDWDKACQQMPESEVCLALIRREAILCGAAVYLYAGAERMPDLTKMHVPLFWGQEKPINQTEIKAPHLVFELPRPNYDQRLVLWQQYLTDHPQADDLSLESVASKFLLTEEQIGLASQRAINELQTRPAHEQTITDADLHQASRSYSNQSLRDLAQKIEPTGTFADIVLTPGGKRQLYEVYVSVKHRQTVYARWGFDEKLAAGKGMTALFYGPSGTGKTMAAGILANELGLDLYTIDLATVVSKYIGETEKNLNRIFTAAESSNAILFFDEADALFGKRSEVKDARDRYANIEVAYLLQKMEAYEGIAILATNLQSNMDEAFARRLHHTVEFRMPDAKLREQIWRSMFPPQAPLAPGIDFPFLARQFDISGGNIRNIAVSAAFLAADAHQPISMEMIATAIARELQKMGKLSTRDAFQQYYGTVQNIHVSGS